MEKTQIEVKNGEVIELCGVLEQIKIVSEKTSYVMSKNLSALQEARQKMMSKFDLIKFSLCTEVKGKILKEENGSFIYSKENEKKLNLEYEKLKEEKVVVELIQVEGFEGFSSLPLYVKSLMYDKIVKFNDTESDGQ